MKVILLWTSILLYTNSLLAINPPSGIGSSANIILWLSPDTALYTAGGGLATVGDDVAEWRDISGNGFNFTNSYSARRPVLDTFNNKYFLNFTPGDFFENTAVRDSINGLDEFSIFITIKSDVTNTDNGFMDSENPNGTDDKICLRYDKSGANTGRTNLLKTGMNGNTSSNQVETQSNTQTTNVQVLTLVWKDGERLKVYIDGVLNDSSSGTVAGPLANVQKIILGKGPKNTSGGLGGGSGWDGLIGDVIFYNKQYSSDTISIVASEISSVKSIASGSWTNASTWDCNCVPPYQVDVTIVSGHTVSLDSSVHVKSLTVQSGATIDLNSNDYDIDMLKHLNLDGSLVRRNGTVSFSGDETSYINGTTTIYQMDVDKTSATVQAQSGAITIEYLLNVNSGTLNANGNIILQSNSSRTANLGQVGGNVIGNLRVQRYLDGLGNSIGYRIFSLPIQGGSITDLQYNASTHTGGIHTYGFTGSTTPSAGGYNSTYSFNESSAVSGSDFNSGWQAATSSSNTVSHSTPMTFYSGGSSYPTYSIEVSGVPNQGNQSINNLSYSSTNGSIGGGWHLVGNPYASSIDWSSVSKTGVNAVGYVYSQTSGAYVATNLLSDQDIIAPFQGFFVRVNNATNSITFSETDKSTISTDFARSSVEEKRLRLRLENLRTNKHVPAALDINERATKNFDSEYDAYSMKNPAEFPSMYFKVDTTKLQVNTVPEVMLANSVDLFMETLQSDSMELSIEQIPNINGCLKLVDHITNKTIEVKVGETYRFWLDKNSPIPNRFTFYVDDNLIKVEKSDLSCYDTEDGKLEVEFDGLTKPWYLVKNAKDTLKTSSIYKSVITDLKSGFYELKWGNSNKECGLYSKGISINRPEEVVANFSVRDTVQTHEDIQLRNLSNGASDFIWKSNGVVFSSDITPAYSFPESGKYKLELIAEQGKCTDSQLKQIIVLDANSTSIESINTDPEIRTYYANEELVINNTTPNQIELKLYDLSGKLITQVGSIGSGEVSILPLYGITRGVYVLKWSNGQMPARTNKIMVY
tara:strand:+ start:1485 stop:4595 length:3111 start_codon:yes stop_codon:yes gene_type:complete